MSHPASNPIPKPVSPSGLRVLVVDDERGLAEFVGSYLTRDGFEVSMAHDGQEAIDQAQVQHHQVRIYLPGLVNCLLPVMGHRHLKTIPGQVGPHELSQASFVVHDQDAKTAW